MFSIRAVIQKMNRPHEKELIVLLNGETSTFNDMLSRSNDTTIHVKNMQNLTIEFYKYLCALSALIMKEIFTKRIFKYNLISCMVTLLPNPKTKKYVNDAASYKAAQLWSTLSARYDLLHLFKSEIKIDIAVDAPAISRIFFDSVGFLFMLSG